ncbi:ABC transporter ATP-binding protein [Clostridium septicum]|uniref:ABC transporter ATP-binding protein n=1 Tax=Clostridium septicum TaxID=1504 RepID=A0A9N7PKJ5_CLOSE|nr:ABC transporter ATP-binding protein [Clostridium septicum]AYE33631.1 ABC transporter ATP-binding protein [Clostridium septicum]MDU1312823.1 ABC transporter ATP-binding protein [Clostridium septicum]QAS61795.1 ABC transporter ATP-binding protein [Clostridium septicum]UEC21756.1 ABC transporter ATP-binding protein [Clostridium septicum]USS00191.1 ABC transporter ATP-binding protein [Clostridium septicum]
MELINLKGIIREYGSGENIVHALRGVDLSINSGELIAIMGPSGSGKTTLLNILGCLDSPNLGEYILNGINITKLKQKDLASIRNSKFGFVVQSFALLDDYTIYENIKIPLDYNSNKVKNKKLKIKEILKMLSIEEKINKYPTELSGGQCQRVAIARALVNNPDIILADEPTGALDKEIGEQVMGIFKEINKSGKTVIIVTHDLNIASQCSRIINIEDGKIKN